MFRTVLMLFVICGLFIQGSELKFLKSYRASLRSGGPCYMYKLQTYPWYMNGTKRRYNRTVEMLDVDMIMEESNLTDDLWIDIQCAKWSNAGWQRNFITLRKDNACTLLLIFFGDLAKRFLPMAGINYGCPISKGKYKLRDFNLDLSGLPFLVMSGIFNLTVTFLEKDQRKILGCFEAIFDVKDAQ